VAAETAAFLKEDGCGSVKRKSKPVRTGRLSIESFQKTFRLRHELEGNMRSPRETVVGLVRFVDDQRRFDLCGKALENTRFS